MPVIKLKHIVSFSSEDPAHPADNLLKSGAYRKWQCADPCEKQASVIIELEKASKISSVDIGNSGSAFIEVLVGRSSSNEYQVLLVASSFMSPSESKSGTNNSRVRMFGSEKLSKAVVDQKWDRVKLVCTQPYSKTSSYGLSFVNFHAPESIEKNETQDKTQIKLGAFILKDEVVDTITSGSFFAKQKEKTEGASSQAKSTAVELREASKSPVGIVTISSVKMNSKPENTERKKESETLPGSKRKVESSTRTADNPKASNREKDQPPVKKTKVAETPESQTREVAINKILKDVVFVLSGFKNPERGNLRDKAMSMGARYRGDWDKTCTHLICAFVNTPKFSQVKATGKGKIVSQKWVHDCLSRKKRLSEKRYKLRGDDSDDDSSTEDESETPAARKTDESRATTSHTEALPSRESTTRLPPGDSSKTISPGVMMSNLTTTSPPKTCSKSSPALVTTTEDDEKKTDDIEENSEPQDNTDIIEDEVSDSGHNTEDETKRVTNDDDDPYNCSTECETDDDNFSGDDDNDHIKNVNHKLKDKTTPTKSQTMDLLNLPDFFSNKTFFLFGDFDSDERRMLFRYITAYDGELAEYMSDNVKFVITNQNWDDNFDEALIENSSLVFVKPKWIYACHEKRSFVPFRPYIIDSR